MSLSLSHIANIIFLCTFIGYLSVNFLISPAFYFSLFLLVLLFARSFYKSMPQELVAYLIALFFGIAFNLVNNNFQNGYFSLINIPAQIGIAIGLIKLLKNNPSIIYLFSAGLYRLVVFAFIFFLISGFDVNEFLRNSKNHVFPLLLSILILSQLASRRARNRDIRFFDIALLFIVSVATMSVAAIVVSVLIMLFYLLRSAAGMKVLGVGIFFSFLIYIVYINSNFIFNNIRGLDLSFINYDVHKLLRGIEEKIISGDVRYSIFKNYIESVGWMSIVFGSNIEMWEWGFFGSDSLYHTSFNLHNSYLLLLAKYGLIVSVLLMVILIKQIFFANIGRLATFLYIALLLRGLSDTIIISHGYLDWCIFMLFFSKYVFGSKPTKKLTKDRRAQITESESYVSSTQLLPKS